MPAAWAGSAGDRAVRILAVNWQDRKHPLAGGAEVHLHEILSRLAAREHQITLLCSKFAGAPAREEYDGLVVERCGERSTFNWSVPGAMRRLLAAERFDVVIDDINKIPFYTPRYVRLPVLAIVHHLFGRAIFREINPIFAAYVYGAEALVPRVYRRTPVMAVSESTREDLVRRGMNPGMIRVVHNGIELSQYRPDPSVPKSFTPRIVYVGRLKRYKAVDHLFAAAVMIRGEFPSLEIDVVGSGDDEPRLRAAARSHDVSEHVHFAGFATLDRKLDFLRRAWVAVCPSLKEGWGLTNIEANACGTAVICADVPGLRDSARDGETGLLYPYGDVAALADRLRRMLRDQPLRDRLGKGGIAWAARFSWDQAATQTEGILERVVAGDRRIAM